MTDEILSTQGVNNTSNPQPGTRNPGASDSSTFQQSAGLDVLNENQTLTVANNGDPIQTAKPKESAFMNGWFIAAVAVFVVVVAIVIWKSIRRPALSEEQDSESGSDFQKAVENRAITQAKGRKKQSRSKRHKQR